MTVSICTLAHGRAAHLTNLVLGLIQSDTQPDELVIAVMQDEPYDLPDAPFPIHQLMLTGTSIPLARARNMAARKASGELLIFLDVDCIPAPACVSDYVAASRSAQGVFMGEVGYLTKDATDNGIDFERFDKVAVQHVDRGGPPEGSLGACEDYRCFWSLNFAISADCFAGSGGFDEAFDGYGGEDTDFSRTLCEQGVPLWWVRGAKAYHQYHPHFMPPVHHLDSVLANAATFARKWGHPTMDHWLRAFTLMGLIERTEDGGRKLREPGEREFAMTRQQADQPYASTAVVLAVLEAEAPAAA